MSYENEALEKACAAQKYQDYQSNGAVGIGDIRRPTLVESMEIQLNDAKKEVAWLEELTALLRNNPEVNRILELMERKY